MVDVRWSRFPLVAAHDPARRWLQFTANLGRARNTVEAYGRAVEDHLRFCGSVGADPRTLRPDVIADWIGDLHARPNRLGMRVRHLDSRAGLSQATSSSGSAPLELSTSISSRMACAIATRFAEVSRGGGVGHQSEVSSAASSGHLGFPTNWRGRASWTPARPNRSGTGSWWQWPTTGRFDARSWCRSRSMTSSPPTR